MTSKFGYTWLLHSGKVSKESNNCFKVDYSEYCVTQHFHTWRNGAVILSSCWATRHYVTKTSTKDAVVEFRFGENNTMLFIP